MKMQRLLSRPLCRITAASLMLYCLTPAVQVWAGWSIGSRDCSNPSVYPLPPSGLGGNYTINTEANTGTSPANGATNIPRNGYVVSGKVAAYAEVFQPLKDVNGNPVSYTLHLTGVENVTPTNGGSMSVASQGNWSSFFTVSSPISVYSDPGGFISINVSNLGPSKTYESYAHSQVSGGCSSISVDGIHNAWTAAP